MAKSLAEFVMLIAFVAMIWAVAGVNAIIDTDLRDYGITPRTSDGLPGIVLHVFLHGDFAHLLANTGPLLIFGSLVALFKNSSLFWLTLFVVVFGGLCVWVFGRSANHIGASGLVFGLFGYLVARGFYERSILSILVAVVVAFFYGGSMIFGVLPLNGFISWEGHLFGLIAGILYAYMSSSRRRRDGKG